MLSCQAPIYSHESIVSMCREPPRPECSSLDRRFIPRGQFSSLTTKPKNPRRNLSFEPMPDIEQDEEVFRANKESQTIRSASANSLEQSFRCVNSQFADDLIILDDIKTVFHPNIAQPTDHVTIFIKGSDPYKEYPAFKPSQMTLPMINSLYTKSVNAPRTSSHSSAHKPPPRPKSRPSIQPSLLSEIPAKKTRYAKDSQNVSFIKAMNEPDESPPRPPPPSPPFGNISPTRRPPPPPPNLIASSNIPLFIQQTATPVGTSEREPVSFENSSRQRKHYRRRSPRRR